MLRNEEISLLVVHSITILVKQRFENTKYKCTYELDISDVFTHVNDGPDDEMIDENSINSDENDALADEEIDEKNEDEQEPEVWEDVCIEDPLCDVENSTPCPEPTPKQTRTQKLTVLVQWLVNFILMWQSVCKLSDNGLEWLLQFLFQFLKVLSNLSGCEYLTVIGYHPFITVSPSQVFIF
ncbi:hypothetical protein OS493_000392 [Desmophyllum pertusum]|uniref:Uncharacterized protein n=1 Tax=Desmophyllum pertusum TaxID=174260 RepID=A0A9X0DC62_9CNID|nr:hypothetical protein OS493_000392 [Desmophyllum pertusum]